MGFGKKHNAYTNPFPVANAVSIWKGSHTILCNKKQEATLEGNNNRKKKGGGEHGVLKLPID